MALWRVRIYEEEKDGATRARSFNEFLVFVYDAALEDVDWEQGSGDVAN